MANNIPEVKLLYCLESKKDCGVPTYDTRRFTTLSDLCLNSLAGTIVKAMHVVRPMGRHLVIAYPPFSYRPIEVRTLTVQQREFIRTRFHARDPRVRLRYVLWMLEGEAWEDRGWVAAKMHFHQNLMTHHLKKIKSLILSEMERQTHSLNYRLFERCELCRRHQKAINKDWTKLMFSWDKCSKVRNLIWWFFFNESLTEELDEKSLNKTMIEYVSSINTRLVSLNLEKRDLALHEKLPTICQRNPFVKDLIIIASDFLLFRSLPMPWTLRSLVITSIGMLNDDEQKILFGLIGSTVAQSLESFALHSNDHIESYLPHDFFRMIFKMRCLETLNLTDNLLAILVHSNDDVQYWSSSEEENDDVDSDDYDDGVKFRGLSNLKTILSTVTTDEPEDYPFYSEAEVDSLFPNLEELKVTFGHSFKEQRDLLPMAAVTNFFTDVCSVDPWKAFMQLPNARKIYMATENSGGDVFSNFRPPNDFKNLTLTDLSMSYPAARVPFEDFLRFFTCFPNLVTFSADFLGIRQFNEREFRNFVIQNKPNLSKLKHFTAMVPSLTLRSIEALLANTNLETCKFLFGVDHFRQDFRTIESFAAVRNLKVVPVLSHRGQWFICSGDKHSEVALLTESCDNPVNFGHRYELDSYISDEEDF